jgi:ketosteroid isomerase-like protein
MRSLWIILPIIAVGLTTSAPAQQVDQATRQQIEQIIAAYHDAWNNHSGAGVAALYTKDAILLTQAPQMVKHGQQEIGQNYEKVFATLPHHDSATADEIIPLGAVNLCRSVNTTSSAVAITRSTGIGLRSMFPKVAN